MWLSLVVYVPPLALRIPWVEDEADAVPVMPRRAAARAKERTFISTEQYTDSKKGRSEKSREGNTERGETVDKDIHRVASSI
jgi:hypothetical protein